MIESRPRELLDRLAADEVTGRHLDLRAVQERAGQLRRRRVLGIALSGAGLAASVALAVAAGTSGPPHSRSTGVVDPASRLTTSYGVTWTTESAPAWTPVPPGSATKPLGGRGPLPSPSPPAAGYSWDRPAYRIPAAAGLAKTEVPPSLILWQDTGPTLQLQARRSLALCVGDMAGDRRLGGQLIAARGRDWSSRNPQDAQELLQVVAGFPAGTGHARFLEFAQHARPCLDSDRDPQVGPGRAPGAELFMLASTMTETLPKGQYVLGVVRVGDVVITLQVSVKATRAEALDLMKRLLSVSMRHLAEARMPPPKDQWVSPSLPPEDIPGSSFYQSQQPLPTETVTTRP